MIRNTLLALLGLLGMAAAMLLFGLALPPVHAATTSKEIFCKVGYHRDRDGDRCLPNAPAGERPPECVLVHVANPAGPGVWIDACGTGSGGESWVRSAGWARRLIADGFTLAGAGCGERGDPCVIVAPGSPAS